MSDTNLRRKFERLVEAAFKKELCEFISMQTILDRISYIGKYISSFCAFSEEILEIVFHTLK